MAAAVSTSTAQDETTDEWELVNDDGFVYKRKKRRLDPTTLVRPPDPALDPAVEEREKRKRKRMALLKIKKKYEREIGLWENLSNTLRAMEGSAKSKPGAQDKPIDSEEKESGKELEDPEVVPVERSSGSFIADLILQVEAQEAIIHNFSHLCDVAESICDAQEEKTKKSFLDLPIWSSPHELMASLCED